MSAARDSNTHRQNEQSDRRQRGRTKNEQERQHDSDHREQKRLEVHQVGVGEVAHFSVIGVTTTAAESSCAEDETLIQHETISLFMSLPLRRCPGKGRDAGRISWPTYF